MAAVALSYLFDRHVSELEAALLDFSTQWRNVGPNGCEIPDLLVSGQGKTWLIEAKVDPHLCLTDAQKLGYLDCFRGGGDCNLCFLVPDDWRHKSVVEDVRRRLGEQAAVQVRYWHDLVEKLKEVPVSTDDVIVKEAVMFLQSQFQPRLLTDPERAFLSTWSQYKYSAFRKLEATVTQAKKLFDNQKFKTEAAFSESQACGFYIMQDSFYVLWVGIWTKAPSPLSFCYHLSGPRWRRPIHPPVPDETDNEFGFWTLDPKTWDDPSILCEVVKAFLQEHYENWPLPAAP